MRSDKDVQVEDSQTLETPVAESKTPIAQPAPAKRNFFQNALRWVIVSLVFLLIGAGVVYFTLYQTAKNSLAAAKAENSQVSDKLSAAEVDLEKAKVDLSTAQLSLNDTNTALQSEQITSLLYKFQADVNAARVAVLNLDPSSAKQALTFAAEDLTALSKTNINADSLSGLQTRIDTAIANLGADPQKAIDSLDTLYTNLLLINNNLK
jgi:hypothetical protein